MGSKRKNDMTISLSTLAKAINNDEQVDINKVLNNSCQECRRRKIKCDSKKPSCNFCLTRSINCVYALNKKKQILSTYLISDSVTKFENRIKNLEQLSLLLNSEFKKNNFEFDNSPTESSYAYPSSNFYSNPHPSDNNIFTPDTVAKDICSRLLQSVISNQSNQGWLDHHKSLLLKLCNQSPIVTNALCALTLACNSDLLSTHPDLQEQFVQLFKNNTKLYLTSSGYQNPCLESIQSTIILATLEYIKGDIFKSSMYICSFHRLAQALNIHNLDVEPIEETQTTRAQRKIWWECFFVDRCSSFMDNHPPELKIGTFYVDLADVHGSSLNVKLEDYNYEHMQFFSSDLDPSTRFLPSLRIKFLDLLQRSHEFATKCINFGDNPELQKTCQRLKEELSWVAPYSTPNIFIDNSQVSNTQLTDLQAAFSMYTNCIFILTYCYTIFNGPIPSASTAWSGFLATGYILKSIEIMKTNENGRWLPAFPYFILISGLTCAQSFYANNDYNLKQLSKTRFEEVYNTMDEHALKIKVAERYLKVLIPVRRRILSEFSKLKQNQHPSPSRSYPTDSSS